MSSATIDRLDYSKAPRGAMAAPLPAHLRRTIEAAGVWGPNAVVAAWAHHKANWDPPGFFVTGDEEADAGQGNAAWLLPVGLTSDRAVAYHDGFAATSAARAAAWAWYDRRLALAGRAERERDGIYLVTNAEPLWPRCLAWSDRDADAVGAWLDDSVGVAPPFLFGGRIAALQRSLDEMRRLWSTTPGIYFDDRQDAALAWPRCLTWSDDQVAAVERWLVDSTAEMPEVLRG